MKVFVLLGVLAVASAASTSSSSSTTSTSTSSSSPSAPSQVASKRGDTDFSASASQQQPVYSASIGQSSGAHSPQGSASDYQAAASNSNLYYYYYPANQHGGSGKSDASSDPYQTSAASSYPSYASEGTSSGQGGYEGSDSGSYGSAYHSQLQQAYAAAAAAQQAHGTGYGQYNPALVGAASSVNQQYASPGAPVHGYQGQATYGGQGPYPAASGFQSSYAPVSENKNRYYGLGSIIMPLVGLGALAFLLPSVTNLGGKKKTKRSADLNEPSKTNIAEYAERFEKYFKIYRAAVESDECMSRIVCELGDSVSGVRGKAALLTLFEKFAPQWMTGKMGVFKFGALNDKNAKCVRYKC